MSFCTASHLETALAYLVHHVHPVMTSVLALSRKGASPGTGEAETVLFGSTDEKKLLNDYFKPRGGPEDKPFFVPFGETGVSKWRNALYPARSLQRQRTGKPDVFRQDPANNRRWSFDPNVVANITADPRDALGDIPISIAHLAVWCYRDQSHETLADAVTAFVGEFRLGDMVGRLFDEAVAPSLLAAPLADAPIDDAELLELLQRISPDEPMGGGPVEPAAEVMREPEAPADWDVTAADFGTMGLVGVEEPVVRMLAALRSGRHVVLTGPPGTGKTSLAEKVCELAGFPKWTVPATDQWTTFETIGGYFPTPQEEGASDRLDFLPGAVVGSIEQGRCLIIDELNRADIDKAFGELFTLLTGNSVTLPYRRRSAEGFRQLRIQVGAAVSEPGIDVVVMPSWWRIIGTMNDADKASLKRLSMAFVRRFVFIPVDLPPADVFAELIRARAGDTRAGIEGKAEMVWLTDVLVGLFATPATGFESLGMPLGPSFPLDMLRQADAEWETDPTRAREAVLASVLESGVLPQFQGRSDLHEEVLRLFEPDLGPDIDVLGRHLAVWTGYLPA